MSKLSKAKDFKKSKSGTYLSMATTAFGAGLLDLLGDTDRAEHDTLRLLDATVSAVAIVTGLAILYRELKRLGDDDVLLG